MHRLLIVLAVSGWALFGYSVLGPQSSKAGAQATIARLTQAVQEAEADRDALAAELGPRKEAHQDLQHAEKRIASVSEELKHLEYLRGRVSGEIDSIRP